MSFGSKGEKELSNPCDIVIEVRRRLCDLWGHDENLNYVGKTPPRSIRSDHGPLRPRDFLEFALQESQTLTDARTRCNCLNNCKRAIDSQVDRLISSLGFLPLARREHWKVPKKLEFISQIGVVAPRILKRVNRMRNRLEHEFEAPSTSEVQDALDVATLFVSYAELVRLPSLGIHFHPGPVVEYDYDEMVFNFFDKEPDDAVDEGGATPVCSLSHGGDGFQDFYDFMTKTVPAMEKRSREG